MIKDWKHKLKTLASSSLTCPAQGNRGRFLACNTARVTAKSSVCWAAPAATTFYSAKPSQGLTSLTSCGGHDAYYCSQINKDNYLLESIWLYFFSLIGILKVEMLYVGMILLFFLGNQFWDKHHWLSCCLLSAANLDGGYCTAATLKIMLVCCIREVVASIPTTALATKVCKGKVM